jgi:hypothetical protein
VADEPGGKPSDLPAFLQDHEKIEEAKFYPPAPPPTAEEGELPDDYGEPKVTLLPVGPYLAYAYWEIDVATLPPETTSAVLRFHDTPEGSRSGSFDVDVDLRARNWYVNLWKPAESYVADLGVKTASGDFLSLARSNPLQTPRAWPVAEIAIEETPPPETPAAIEAEVVAEPVFSEPATKPTIETPVEQDEPLAAAAPEAETPAQEPEPPKPEPPKPEPPKPVDAVEVLQAKLAEIYSLRQWHHRATIANPPDDPSAPYVPYPSRDREGAVPEDLTPPQTGQEEKNTRREPRSGQEAAPASPTPQPITPPDLTQLAETQFSPGVSSALPPQQRPEKPG